MRCIRFITSTEVKPAASRRERKHEEASWANHTDLGFSFTRLNNYRPSLVGHWVIMPCLATKWSKTFIMCALKTCHFCFQVKKLLVLICLEQGNNIRDKTQMYTIVSEVLDTTGYQMNVEIHLTTKSQKYFFRKRHSKQNISRKWALISTFGRWTIGILLKIV